MEKVDVARQHGVIRETQDATPLLLASILADAHVHDGHGVVAEDVHDFDPSLKPNSGFSRDVATLAT